MKPFKIVGIQYAALPFRVEGRQVQILLITSRGVKRWVIPKGWPIDGLKPPDAAAAEAAEEAGLVGEVEDRPIGSYRYQKRLKGERTTAVQVIVFPFMVRGHAEQWKEQDERRIAWFRYQKAAALVAEPSLRHLIRELGASHTSTLLARSLRTYRSLRTAARASPAPI
jgi:8-oxo-dGTP pyrophosphatase MutT (NUDIX family)